MKVTKEDILVGKYRSQDSSDIENLMDRDRKLLYRSKSSPLETFISFGLTFILLFFITISLAAAISGEVVFIPVFLFLCGILYAVWQLSKNPAVKYTLIALLPFIILIVLFASHSR